MPGESGHEHQTYFQTKRCQENLGSSKPKWRCFQHPELKNEEKRPSLKSFTTIQSSTRIHCMKTSKLSSSNYWSANLTFICSQKMMSLSRPQLRHKVDFQAGFPKRQESRHVSHIHLYVAPENYYLGIRGCRHWQQGSDTQTKYCTQRLIHCPKLHKMPSQPRNPPRPRNWLFFSNTSIKRENIIRICTSREKPTQNIEMS